MGNWTCRHACWLALALSLLPAPSFGQDSQDSYASAPSGAGATPQDTAAADADNSEFWRKVNLDPALLSTPAKPLKARPSLFESKSLDVKRNDNPDGTASISINKPLPTAWDTNVGSDLGFSDTTRSFDVTRPMPAINDQQSRAVWANVAVPDVASINTRVDSGQDQGKLGTSVQRSVPLGERFSVSVQDTYSVTEAYGIPAVTSPVPLASAPVASTPTTPGLPQVWGNDRQVKLNVLPTGTTLGAGWTNTTGDPVTHNTFSAEQKVYGALHVTTSVTDIGQPSASKSITAGFKVNW